MNKIKLALIFTSILFLNGCSFPYNILILNESDAPIEIHYKISEKAAFDTPKIISIEDWKNQKSIRKIWTEKKEWSDLQETEYQTNLETRERVIKIQPHQMVEVEQGHYNPVSEEFGDLTGITELKIITSDGEIAFTGKLLLSQFEKDGYTFIKTYEDKVKVSEQK